MKSHDSVTPVTPSGRGGLTDFKVRNCKPDPTKRIEIADGKQANLYLVIQPSGKRSFAVRYRFNGKPKKLTLKAGLSLADARRLAAQAVYEIQIGTDPRDKRKSEERKSANTLQAVCERYLKREGAGLRSARQRECALRRLAFPVLGHRPIDSIKRTEISHLLDAIQDKNGPRAADLVLSYLRKIFNWYAVNYSDTFTSPIVPGMGRYNYSERRRKRILSDDEIRQLWQATADGGPLSSLMRFLLLVGCRRSEGAEIEWSEIDGNQWTLPASRHKNKKVDLLRPLSKAALDIINAQPRIDGSPFVFTTTGRAAIGFNSVARRFLNSFRSDWTVHDLRRTFRSLAARAGVDFEVAERCIGHMPSGLVQTYNQHRYMQEMVRAFEAVAALIDRIVNPSSSDVVTPMRGRSKA
jgi:integrase